MKLYTNLCHKLSSPGTLYKRNESGDSVYFVDILTRLYLFTHCSILNIHCIRVTFSITVFEKFSVSMAGYIETSEIISHRERRESGGAEQCLCGGKTLNVFSKA